MKKFLPATLLVAFGLLTPAWAQTAAPLDTTITRTVANYRIFRGELPADLPTAGLLFIRYTAADVPPKRPDNVPAQVFRYRKTHNDKFAAANEQLLAAAQKYPYKHRITTQDSAQYYRTRGYRYELFFDGFNRFYDLSRHDIDVNASGGKSSDVRLSDLYVLNLDNNSVYVFEEFNENYLYYYKGIVGMLLKKVNKQFGAGQ
ncbi:hypothetical protein JAO73_09400 [Hymenobacter sp. BT523]|uniref:hypothetical protein n=1 Tax=Hymenobacter sp. BT523 TaxID=2795725 RepID=UPI0018ED963A|nr:hypothetical protein [Hymenobacter sp. BT523]MBJ6109226.1 hypothetical protein [Hymenobacter sp. BT523]